LAQAHPGGIVLMHETSRATVDALPRVIKGLRARGYRLVTVSELLAAGRAEEVAR
jgi:peptidoglycan/xylan/chitin deacetylase (PgdA/CDA1 family)